MLGSHRVGTFARLLIPVILLTACRFAHAACIASPDPAIRDLQALAVANPNQALMRTEAMLRVAAAHNAPALDVAWLHSVRAHAFSALELDADARAAAAAGMKLVPDVREPVRLALFFTDSENVYDAEGIAAAKRTVEAMRAAGVAGRKPNGACCSRSVSCSFGRIAPTSRS